MNKAETENHIPFVIQKELEAEFEKWIVRKGNEKFQTEPDKTEKFDELTEGLEFYLNHADSIQEKLIQLNLEAATKTILVEGILVQTDQNKVLDSQQALADKLSLILQALLDRKEAEASKMSQEFASDLWPLVKQTQQEPNHENSRVLREEIERLVLAANTSLSPLSEASITLFQQSRQAQTTATNEYQQQLIEKKEELKQLSGMISNTDEIPPILDKLSIIHKRLTALESFRTGITDRLTAQPEEITEMGIKDLTSNFRSFETKLHPGIAKAKEMSRELQYMVDAAPNAAYRRNLSPEAKNNIYGVKIKESGIKSWKSTIRKLFNKKGAQWKKMTDLSRINPVFWNAESMYFYNRSLHQVGSKLEWEHTQITPKQHGDKGLRMVDSGTVNWNCCLQYNDEHLGKGFFAETKLDAQYISRTEPYSHLLFELARKFFKQEREVDIRKIEDSDFRIRVSSEISNALELLVEHNGGLSDEVKRELETIQVYAKEFPTNKQLFPSLHQKILDTETMIRFQAARDHASPTMAAMTKMAFDKMCKNLSETPKAHLQALFDAHGPKMKIGKVKGQYSEADLKLVKKMQAEYEARMTASIEKNSGLKK